MDTRIETVEGGYALMLGEERVGYADVVMRGDVAVLPHVEIDPASEGKGFGSKLVKEMLSDLKAKGKTIEAQCPFVVAYLARHPEAG